MAKLKPKVFVGSSSEARLTAEAFCDVLEDVAVMVPWWLSKEFQAMQSVLDGLVDACNSYDFGLFILTPDDKLESRGTKGMSARDNVLFELSLFLGKLGANRTFAVIQDAALRRKKVKISLDLAGIVLPHFTAGDRDTLVASVCSAANSLRPIIQREWRRHGRIKLAASWGYDLATRTFSMTLSGAKLERNKAELSDKELAIVARKRDEDLAPEHDERIAIGPPRMISMLHGDLVLRAVGDRVFNTVQVGDTMFGHLLLIPSGCTIANKKKISDMLDDGCELLESKGVTVKAHSEVDQRSGESD